MECEVFKEKGVVIAAEGGRARVRIFDETRSSEKCAACGCCSTQDREHVVELDGCGAGLGDVVEVEVTRVPMARGVFYLFALPIILFMAGAALGELLVPEIFPSLADASTVAAVVLAFGLMGGCYLAVYLAGGKITGNVTAGPRIIRVIPSGGRAACAPASVPCRPATVIKVKGTDEETAERTVAELKKVRGVKSARFNEDFTCISVEHEDALVSRGNLREILAALGVRVE